MRSTLGRSALRGTSARALTAKQQRQRPSRPAGRGALKCVAYVATSQLHSAAQCCLPSPFLEPKENHEGTCTPGFIDATTRYHGSAFLNDLFMPQSSAMQDGAGRRAIEQQVARWQNLYTPLTLQTLAVAADPGSQDVFMLFASSLVNTGSFGGAGATMERSGVLGMYRLHLDAQGHLDEVWCYRGGTQEERQHLVKPEACQASASMSAGGQTQGVADQLLAAWPGMAPSSSASDASYVATILQRAAVWNTDVMSKGCLSSLFSVAAPNVTLWDGTELLHAPIQGAEQVGAHLLSQQAGWELGTRRALATAAEPGSNKVFTHWSQAATCRTTGAQVHHRGVSMLVFNAQARVQQVLDFTDLNEVQRRHLLRLDAAEQLLASWVSMDEGSQEDEAAAVASAEEAARIEAEAAAADQAACLARQEAEWMSW